MGREINEEKEFSENIDRILAGQKVEVGEDVSEDFRAAIQFAQKLEELRDEPLPVFKDQLRRRLLLKLAEKEAAAEEQKEKRFSFWETLRNLVPRSPVWRTAVATVVVAVLAVVVVWGSGIFVQAPEQAAEREPGLAPATAPAPKVTPEEPSVAMLDSRAILNLEPVLEEAKVYMPGEEIKIDLVFSNTGSEPIILTSFPPVIQISRVDTGAVVRSFAPGSESTEILASGKLDYTLVWDQLDDGGKQVEPGRYSVIVGDVSIQKSAEPREAQVGFGYVTEVTIEAP